MSDYCYGFPLLNQVLKQVELMDRMIDRLGLTPIEVIRYDKGASWYEARTRCIDCQTVNECKVWLAKTAIDGAAPEQPAFCPNAALFGSIGKA